MDLIACSSQCDIERGYNSDSDTGEVNDSSTGDNYTLNKESFTISSHKTSEIFVGVVSVYVSPIAFMNPLLEVNNASITENFLLHIIIMPLSKLRTVMHKQIPYLVCYY